MFFQNGELQYEVEVEEPDPQFAKLLQQAIGGVEGEMRVALQYMFQAMAVPEEQSEYRHMLMETAAEELGHIEMLATAVTKNLRGAPREVREEARQDAAVDAAMTGQSPRQVLSAGMSAMPVDSNGVPFDAGCIVASGNLAADMYANVMAESTGRLLATRLYERTDDEGMKDMLAYLIARDTMHQNQWLEVLDTFDDHLPVPASFPQEKENDEFNYSFMSTSRDPHEDPGTPWTSGESSDGKGEFSFLSEQPGGGEPGVGMADESVNNHPTDDG
ncbi:manganese catalase family protein [Halostella litorea]|uniref:manganese catalase family protein n=1 Tax=Halostella litorea TaxID=2528831 RepID=UPI001093169B|nr:manganese catalase family protein [Halostella litorea]